MADEEPGNRIDGNVHTALQAGTIVGGVHFHGNARVLEPEPVVAPPRGWDDRPELPPEIENLLEVQRRTAKDLPYRLRGARRPSLATVYVRQDVSSETDSEPTELARPLPDLDSRGLPIDVPARPVPRLMVRPPARTVQEALDDHDHLLVTGGPGQGKSTLSLRLAADIAARWAGEAGDAPLTLAEPVIPVRLPARELATRLGMAFFQALAESIQAEYGADLDFSITAGALARPVAGCRWLLLIDGMDEVADLGQRDRLIKVLAARASTAPSLHYRIVLTTRPIAGAALSPFHGAGAARYELLSFDEKALRDFAGRWFDEDETAEAFVRQVHVANLDELVRVPLLATIAAIMFEQHDDRSLPDNRYELYEEYLAYLRFARPTTASPWDEYRERLLEHLGRVRLEGDTSLQAAAWGWATTHVPHACGGPEWREELTTYLTTVGPFVSRSGDVTFLHHSFADHLAATADARRLPDRFDPDAEEFVKLVHQARPEERGRHARSVLLHYTRLRETETNRLIGYLHAGTSAMHVLAARLLAWHAPARTEVVDAFLDKARAWAMTTQYPAQLILTEVSRAAHHRGLAAWLLGLMRDEEAPWESRIGAGRALAVRLYGTERADAVAMLRSVVEDESVAVEFRFEAAKALADSGTDEHASAVTGLLSVLADATATGLQYRGAAIVLAGLGHEPRRRAIAALAGLLDDPRATQTDMVQAARGLVEIGAEYEDRCAKLFRTVLAGSSDVRDAALGLASLGPQQLAEVATTLKAQLADRRLSPVFVAGILAELGPQQQLGPEEVLSALPSSSENDMLNRVITAAALAEFGPQYHEHALTVFREAAARRVVHPIALPWMASAFADLGVEHHVEVARVLNRAAGNPLTPPSDRVLAFGKLADLGEPHRTPAVRALRAYLTNPATDPDSRVQAGDELLRLEPEFHAEVAEHVLEVASDLNTDPATRVDAWRSLRSLGSEHRQRASRALLELMGPEEASAWEVHETEEEFYDDDTDDRRAASSVLTAVLRDPERSVRHRVAAAHSLVNLGRLHHAEAVNGVIMLLHQDEIPADELATAISGLSDVNVAQQAALAERLTSALDTRRDSSRFVLVAASVLDQMGRPDNRLRQALRALRDDESAAGADRSKAAVLVAKEQRADAQAAVTIVLELRHVLTSVTMNNYLKELVGLGADVPEEVKPARSIPEVEVSWRKYYADLLLETSPELLENAVAELRSQATDVHLSLAQRTSALLRLAELDPAMVDDAISLHREVLHDESQAISDRCKVANNLVRLDPAQHADAMAVLRRLAGRPGLYDIERAAALNWLDSTNPSPGELRALARAIALDPATSSATRQETIQFLPAPEFRSVLLAMITDRTVPVASWPATIRYWDNWALATEAEAVLRDVLAGSETSPGERVAAAVGLAQLSPRLIPEAVAVLAALEGSGHVRRQRLLALGELDPAWRARILTEPRTVLDGDEQVLRHRIEAAKFLSEIIPSPLTAADLGRLARLLRDDRIADQVRLQLLQVLERFDDIRAIRDDERTPPATRWLAVNVMRDYRCEDRERGARILAAIADDPETRLPLRWRAAEDLARFGTRGRELAVERLRAMMTDETLSVLTRVNVARALGDIRADLHSDVLRFLRRLEVNNIARIHLLKAFGRHEPQAAAWALRAMAEDPTQTPVARLRCAKAMSKLHRDYREPAALLCRELAHDTAVPCHIRADAARGLALLSSLCRQEARDLLADIRANWGRHPNRASAAAQSAVPEGS